MHIVFSAGRRRESADGDPEAANAPANAGRMMVVRDPDDESEWQYLGNPQVATTTSLKEVVERFIADCSGADGSFDPGYLTAARELRDALLGAARLLEDTLAGVARK